MMGARKRRGAKRDVQTKRETGRRARYPRKSALHEVLRARWPTTGLCQPVDVDGRALRCNRYGFAQLCDLCRLQPATVIRVSADGEATVVGGRPSGSAPAMT